MSIFAAIKDKVLTIAANISAYISGRVLNETLRELQASYTARTDSLLAAYDALNAKLQELINEKHNQETAKAQAIVAYFETQAAELLSICTKLENAALLLKETTENIPQLPSTTRPTVAAVNKISDEFNELQKTIINTLNGDSGLAIEKFDKITAVLEKNINKTWESIDETLNKNAKELFATYERFFDICNVLAMQTAIDSENVQVETIGEKT